MNLLALMFRLPFLPLQGLIQLGGLVGEQADRELHDPAAVRRQLEDAEEARSSGAVSDQDVARIQREAVGRLVSIPGPPAAGRSRRDRG
jgi:hypothetical protein